MSDTQVMRGTLKFVCTDFMDVFQHEIEYKFYGKTPGELVDDLVSAARKITSDTEDWIASHPDPDYNLMDDNWRIYLAIPDPSKTVIKIDMPVYTEKHIMICSVVWRRHFLEVWEKYTTSKLRRKNRNKFKAALEGHPKHKNPGLVCELPHDIEAYGISGAEYDSLAEGITDHKIPKALLKPVFSGSLIVGAQNSSDKTIFYSDERVCYGDTVGELWDNLVELSVDSANAVQTWQILNRTSSYSMKDDYWYTLLKFPDVSQKRQSSAAGSSLQSVSDVVKASALNRDVMLRHWMQIEEVQIGGKGFTDEQIMPPKPEIDYAGISVSKTFREMTSFGTKGSDYDSYMRKIEALNGSNTNLKQMK